MSKFSGKYDLYDLIYHHPNESEDVAFKKFKVRTRGKLFQCFPLELTPDNIDYEIAHNASLSRIVEPMFNENSKYKYRYLSKGFKTLKELNAYGYCAVREIPFERKIDLIPYYSYAISLYYTNEEEEYVYISEESYVDKTDKYFRKYRGKTHIISSSYSYYKYYKQQLANEYIRVAKGMLKKKNMGVKSKNIQIVNNNN